MQNFVAASHALFARVAIGTLGLRTPLIRLAWLNPCKLATHVLRYWQIVGM